MVKPPDEEGYINVSDCWSFYPDEKYNDDDLLWMDPRMDPKNPNYDPNIAKQMNEKDLVMSEEE